MRISHLYTGPDGQSHFGELEIPWALSGDSGRHTTEPLPSEGAGIGEALTLNPPRGFHNAPRRQFVAVLKGGLEVEMGDGSKRVFGPGDVFLADDLRGQGHKTRDTEPTRVLYVYVPAGFDPAPWKV